MARGLEGERIGFNADISGLASAAHELKTPTALIRQLAIELREESENNIDIIDQIILLCERSIRLTSSLTKTVKLDASNCELEPVNPQQLCLEVASELEPMFDAHGRELDVVSRKNVPLVVANTELLRRILLNFGDNALHYSKSRVVFSIEKSLGCVNVCVRDQGPVLPSSNIKGRMSLTGRPQSSGIGLMISQKFASMMNSKIGFRRHRDGMTFYVSMVESSQLVLL